MNLRSKYNYIITKFFNFSKSRNKKSLPNIAVGEARGTCLPETSGGDELKGAGVGLVLLAGRDDRGLVRTETTRRSAGRRRTAAEPLPEIHHAIDDRDVGYKKHRHHQRICQNFG